MSIDPRLLERRRHVAEERARRKVGRLVKVLTGLALVGSVVWLFLSPLLSVRQVVTEGVSASSAHRTLAEMRVVAGTPMILLDPAAIEERLLGDPWIRGAEVTLEWPGRVLVTIEERHPVVWAQTGGGWKALAADGVVLFGADQPDETMGRVLFPDVGEEETHLSRPVVGAVAFVTTLEPSLQPGTVVWPEGNGELWAEVAGFPVRLGREVDMEAKALSLQALLAESPPPGSTLILIAPTHPSTIGPEADGEEGPEGEGEEAGADSEGSVEG